MDDIIIAKIQKKLQPTHLKLGGGGGGGGEGL